MQHNKQVEQIIQNRQKLCKALRSGHYSQGHYHFYAAGNFCVLGLAGYIVSKVPLSNLSGITSHSPCDTLESLGLRPGVGMELVERNDRLGWTFPEFADWLEQQPIHIE